MSVSKYLCCAVLAALLAACSSHSAAGSADQPASASTALPASNPLKPLLDTRNRAKAVQQDLKAHDQAERKALKDAQQ